MLRAYTENLTPDPRHHAHEDGWHVRSGLTMEQLECVLEENGFEPVDRMRYGTLDSTVVTRDPAPGLPLVDRSADRLDIPPCSD